MPWYKYLPQEIAELMVKKGSVKIGTLFDYKNEDELGTDIGDKNEGVLTEWSNDKETKRTQSDLNRIEKLAFRIKEGLEGVQIKDCLVQATQQSPDFFIYSVSDVFNVHIMRKLCRDYHTTYDACVRIIDPNAFINAVSKLFKDKGHYETSAYIQYMDRTRHYKDLTPHPALIKEPKFEYQKEIRSIWSPVITTAIPEIIEAEEIKQYCQIIYIDKCNIKNDEVAMVRLKGNKFNNDRILIDNSEFADCEFHNCTIVYSGSGPVGLNSCAFYSCQWEFTGAANNTINFMASLYHGLGEAGKELIEKTFDNIRSKGSNL